MADETITAEEPKIHIYSTRAGIDSMKSAVEEAAKEAGVVATAGFDRATGAHYLKTDGLAADAVAKVVAGLGDYTSDAAKDAWSADREAGQAEKAALKGEAKAREPKTTEKAPEVAADSIKMWPAPSQRGEWQDEIIKTGSTYTYARPVAATESKPERGAYFAVKTEHPKVFEKYTTPEAEAKFKAEHAAGVKPTKGKGKSDVDVARDAAIAKKGGAFMSQYREKGFLLAHATNNAARHGQQIAEMSNATDTQLRTVIAVSRTILEPLVSKELNMRAEAVGMKPEAFAEQYKTPAAQKEASTVEGKSTGLTGDEFTKQQQLLRGISAIRKEIDARGNSQEVSREQSQERPAKEKVQDRPVETGRAKGKGAQREVAAEQGIDDVAQQLAFQGRRRGQGR